MTTFQKKPLGLLDSVYRFLGGLKAVNRVDLESDVTLVHDVSRYAERAGMGPYFGYLDWIHAYTTGAATGKYRITRSGSVQPVLGLDNEDYELWVLGASYWVLNGYESKFTRATLYHGHNGDTPRKTAVVGDASEKTFHPILKIDSGGPPVWMADQALGATIYWGDAVDLAQPIRVEPNGFLGWASTTTSAIVVQWTVNMWAGPPGATPPGMP